MAIFPALVTLIAGLFAVQLARQYHRRRKLYQLIWAFSLTCGAIAGATFLLFLLSNRQTFWFRAYYVSGALLMAAYLGMGSIALLAPQKWARRTLAVLLPLSIVGIVVIATAPIHAASLHVSNVEAGTTAISGVSIVFIAVFNTFGAIAVIVGALYSSWTVWRQGGPPRFLVSNGLIAIGTLLASLAGTLARLTGAGAFFWVLLALGFLVLYSGFTIASRAPRSNSRRPVST